LVVGFVGGAGWILYSQESKAPNEMSIIFAKKNYFDSPDAVLVSGTLTGPGLGYPNNTYAMGCYREHKECWMTYVQAIGGLQIGRMDAPSSYEIRKWTDSEVVAGHDAPYGCFKTTITIERRTQVVLWVEEPVNQTSPSCKDAKNEIRKYTIENSPGWDKIFGKK
jgi:hypothetical protein